MKGVLFVTLGTGIFSFIFISAKFAGEAVSAPQVMLLRFLGSILFIAVIVLLRRKPLRSYKSRKPRAQILRAFLAAFGGASAIYAAAHMPIVHATAIGLIEGVLVVVFGIVLLKEVVSLRHWSAALVCLSGAAIVVSNQGTFSAYDVGYLFPSLAALLGATLMALESILIKVLATSERTFTVVVYTNIYGAIFISVPAIWTWKSVALADNIPYLLLGPLAVLAQYINIKGFALADVSIVGPVIYTWILFAGFFGFVFFSEIPTGMAIMGSALIVLGGYGLAKLPTTKRRVRPINE